MKILFYGINFAPELTGIGKYSGEWVEDLTKRGHEVTVITAPPYYPQWQIQKPYSKWWFRTEHLLGAKVIRCPLYVPNKPGTLKRLLHLLDFALSSFLPMLFQIRHKPDLIITVEPTFFCVPTALLVAKCSGAKSCLHIQDFEIDAMFQLDFGKPKSLLAKMAFGLERFFMRRFTMVSSISAAMLDKAHKKGVDQKNLCLIPNWADTDFIKPLPASSFRNQWKLADTDFVFLYSGNIGQKQGLDILADAARHFSNQPGIKIIIAGDGAFLQTLKLRCEGLDNILFKPLQPLEKLNELLAVADVHLVIQKAGAADIVFPSKLTNILAAGGHSIITADKGTALHQLCHEHPGIADCIEAENSKALVTAMENSYEAHKDKPSHNAIARQYALEHLGKEAILSKAHQMLVDNDAS